MKYQQATASLADYRKQIGAIRARMRELQAEIEPQPVEDYVFAGADGERRLSQLFADKADLIVIHNMGASCPYCTMWADGFNGVYAHLADRAAFVVISPDPVASQQAFARKRGWRFPLLSHRDTSFAADMGYRSGDGGYTPGVSAFQKRAGRLVRVNDLGMGPGDDFCSVWHFYDLLPEGSAGWRPRFSYPEAGASATPER